MSKGLEVSSFKSYRHVDLSGLGGGLCKWYNTCRLRVEEVSVRFHSFKTVSDSTHTSRRSGTVVPFYCLLGRLMKWFTLVGCAANYPWGPRTCWTRLSLWSLNSDVTPPRSWRHNWTSLCCGPCTTQDKRWRQSTNIRLICEWKSCFRERDTASYLGSSSASYLVPCFQHFHSYNVHFKVPISCKWFSRFLPLNSGKAFVTTNSGKLTATASMLMNKMYKHYCSARILYFRRHDAEHMVWKRDLQLGR